MMHVLHITGWFPNYLVPHETPFIERHISALSPHCRNSIWHIDTRPGDRWTFTRKGPKAHRTFLVTTPLSRWFIIEWISTLLILWSWLTRDRSQRVDLVNFHIAYPNCTHIRLLRWVMRRPMLITEHWSIYHFSFNSKAKGLDRVRAIFHAGVPLIVVSQALEDDIARFAGPPRPKAYIIDNAVEPEVFHYRPEVSPRLGVFLTIAGWQSPKRPEMLLEAMACMREGELVAQLRIAGTGPKIAAMRARIAALGLEDHVVFLGQLGPEDVANEMRNAHALVHSSDYETYSAVCAEALCCGTPVIASAVGGVPGLVLPDRGVLVPENTVEAWTRVWSAAWSEVLRMDRAHFARDMMERVNSGTVGERYFNVLKDVEHLSKQKSVQAIT
ncbi:MAG: glycosyltransferase [Flavobacteriales bacterium]